MATAVVTGGAGFLGSHLCDYLLARGDRVICVDNLETGSLRNIEHIRADDFVFVHHDVVDRLEIEEAGRLRLPPRRARQPDRLPAPAAAHAEGRLVRDAQRARPREVQARPLPARVDERGLRRSRSCTRSRRRYWGNVNPIGPRGVYDEAKRYAEALTMAYHRQQGVDTAIVRIFNTYGPRMRPHDGRAIPTFVRQALAGEPLTVFGDGSQTRSFCYVDDLVRGLLPAGDERRAPAGQHRQPRASSRCSSWRRLVLARHRLDERDRVRGAAGRRPARCASLTSRARSRCSAGSRRSTLEEGLRRLIDSIRARAEILGA